MSQIQTQTRELTEEETVKLIRKVIEEGKEEAVYILTLELRNRWSGCGYLYLYRESLEVLEGNADIVTLSRSEFNCSEVEELAIIPKTLPVVIKVMYIDEDPEVSDTVTYYVFTSDGWKSIKVSLPKP